MQSNISRTILYRDHRVRSGGQPAGGKRVFSEGVGVGPRFFVLAQPAQTRANSEFWQTEKWDIRFIMLSSHSVSPYPITLERTIDRNIAHTKYRSV